MNHPADIRLSPQPLPWLARLVERFRPNPERGYRGPSPVNRPAADNPPLPLISVRQRERLLLFLALDGAPEGLDPIRIQKGMFLFAQEGVSTGEDRYQFVPYNYGPMSTQIYKDLERMEDEGLVEAIPVQGQSWARYIATESGLVKARELLKREPSEEAERRLHAIKQDVSSKTFSALLDDVYDRYPEYAAKSIFRRAS